MGCLVRTDVQAQLGPHMHMTNEKRMKHQPGDHEHTDRSGNLLPHAHAHVCTCIHPPCANMGPVDVVTSKHAAYLDVTGTSILQVVTTNHM